MYDLCPMTDKCNCLSMSLNIQILVTLKYCWKSIIELKVQIFCYFVLFSVSISVLETETSTLYEFPDWFPYLEYALLTMISMTVLMAAGCVCLKCCQFCGCDSSDDDTEENKRMQRISKFHRQRPRKLSPLEF